jgi:hypothetical protein
MPIQGAGIGQQSPPAAHCSPTTGPAGSGPIDGVDPDTYSRRHTDSAVFRLVSRRSDFRNVRVEFAPDVARLISTTRTPPQAYDGVHVFLRYKSAQLLDAISVFRRTARSRSRRRCPAVR